MRKETTRKSKTTPGITYTTTAVGSLRYVEITYNGKYLYKSRRPQKVSKVIAASESMLENAALVWSFYKAATNTATDADLEIYMSYKTGLTHPDFEA